MLFNLFSKFVFTASYRSVPIYLSTHNASFITYLDFGATIYNSDGLCLDCDQGECVCSMYAKGLKPVQHDIHLWRKRNGRNPCLPCLDLDKKKYIYLVFVLRIELELQRMRHKKNNNEYKMKRIDCVGSTIKKDYVTLFVIQLVSTKN